MGNIALVLFIAFYLDFVFFVYIIVYVFLRFRFGCAMLFLLLASYGRSFITCSGFFLYFTEFRFFVLILSVGLSLGNFSTNFLNMQPGLTSCPQRVSIPPFFVYITSCSIWLVFLHFVQRLYYLKLQPGLIVLSLRGSICRNLIVILGSNLGWLLLFQSLLLLHC